MNMNILINDKFKQEVNENLLKSIDHLVDFNQRIILKPEFKKRIGSLPHSHTFLAKSIFGFLEYLLNINNLDEEEISKVDKAFEKSVKFNQNDHLFFLKSQYQNEYKFFKKENSIQLLDNDLFGENDDLFDGLRLIDLFISFCNQFRYRKFCYFIDEHLKDQKVRQRFLNNRSFNTEAAFPDANSIFIKFIELRITLFYIDYLLDRSSKFQLQNRIKIEKEQSNKAQIDFTNLTYESDPVFKLFFASAASFEVFKLTIIPFKGEKKLSKGELMLIFEFFRENKLKYQSSSNYTATPMGRTSDKSLFIKSINPFFKEKLEENERFSNASISSTTGEDIMSRLEENYKKVKSENKSKKIQHF